jgi:hypothetical protein
MSLNEFLDKTVQTICIYIFLFRLFFILIFFHINLFIDGMILFKKKKKRFERFIRWPAIEKERGREIRTATEKEREEERSVTHAHRPTIEKERGRENRSEYVVFRQDLSLYPARERCRAWVSTGFGRKPRRLRQIRPETQTTSPDPAGTAWISQIQHSLPSSRSRHSVEISSPV